MESGYKGVEKVVVTGLVKEQAGSSGIWMRGYESGFIKVVSDQDVSNLPLCTCRYTRLLQKLFHVPHNGYIFFCVLDI